MFPQNGRKLESVKNKNSRYFLSSVLYLIKQLFHSRLLDMSLGQPTRCFAPRPLSISIARSWNNMLNSVTTAAELHTHTVEISTTGKLFIFEAVKPQQHICEVFKITKCVVIPNVCINLRTVASNILLLRYIYLTFVCNCPDWRFLIFTGSDF